MRRRATLSLALALGLLLWPGAFTRTARPQESSIRGTFTLDRGIFTPVAGQVIRLSYTPANGTGDALRVRFAWMRYGLISCSSDTWAGVCRQEVVSQGATEPVSVSGNEAASFNIQGNGQGIRVIVESSSRNALVVLQLIDTSTGEVVWADEARVLEREQLAASLR